MLTPAPIVFRILLLFCMTTLPWQANAARPFCGDNKCNGGETVLDCPGDCTAGSVCGDNTCSPDETCSSCASDCGICPEPVCNNDGICNAGEDCTSCPGDCAGVTGGKPSNRYCCGADTCAASRCGAGCGSPMSSPVCGNGLVETGEQCDDGNTTSGDGCDGSCAIEQPSASAPSNQFNIGDSIGEGEAADGTIGEAHHETVWSTGYDSADAVDSLNERFEKTAPADFYENTSGRDAVFNHAVSGAVMADFATQAQELVASTQQIPEGNAGQVTVLLGNNDVCADSLDAMTEPAVFEAQYRAGLDVLSQNPSTRDAAIHVSSIPAIYWLWNAKRNDFACRLLIWPFVPCQNLLANAGDDCASSTSRENPDVIDSGDGPNCVRRKQFHGRIRDEYNPILQNVLAEYRDGGQLPNAAFVNVFDVRFDSSHVNGGDCFHPSEAGHALLAEKQYCRSQWGNGDPLCTQ